MRIRSLEITGFKSFADRTVLAFDRGISAIVGPNGCGKSNVIDALRWVMGEQNPRRLRGSIMEDMIFSGSDKRQPIGMSEVVLTLDNSDGLAVPPYDGFSEIQVARRLYRSGESEYLINKTHCRLRDVLDFFLDTGVGTRGYTIVEQGHIADLVSNKPEDRRQIFEQAAGIGKYRQRRRETESKLKSTEQNLLRVNDILIELKRQIGALDRQAAKAKRFKKLKAELRDLELVVAKQEYTCEADALADSESNFERLRAEASELDARVSREEAELETGRRAHLDHERELQQMSEKLYSVRSAIQSLESRVDYERREREGLLQLADERESEVRELEEQHGAHIISLNEAVGELSSVQERLSADETDLARRDGELRAESEKLSALQGRREGLQARLVELSADEATIESQGEALEDRRNELEIRLRENDEALEQGTEAADALRRDEAGIEARLRRGLAESEELGRLFAEQLRSGDELRARSEELTETLGQTRERLHQVAAQLESQREIERRESMRAAALLEQIPAAERGAIRARLTDVIRVADGLEPALEAVLAGRLESLLVEGSDAALSILAHLREKSVGRATLLPLGAGEVSGETGFVPLGRSLSDFLDVDERYLHLVQRLLADVYVVDNLQQAIDRFGIGGCPAVFVTRDGEILDRSGTLTGGLGVPPGALSRAGEIRRLAAELESLEPRCEALAVELAELNERGLQLEAEIENTRNRRHTAELAVVNLEKDLERTRERSKEALQLVEGHRTGKEALLSQTQRNAERLDELAERRSEFEQSRAKAELLRRELSEEIQTLIREVERTEQRLVQSRIELAELGARRDQLLEARDRLQNSVDEAHEWINRRKEEVDNARERAETLQRSCEEASRELSEKIGDEEQLRLGQDQLREAYESSAQTLESVDQSVREAHQVRETHREQLSNFELSLQEARLKRDQVIERMRERYDLDIAAYEPTEEQLAGDPAQREAELEKLRQTLRSLGDVHLGAIEEYEEVSERHRYLSEQKGDLELSIERLRGAIGRINRTSRNLFRQTFEAIDKEFRVIFPRMFDGGRAHLSLTESEDVLEAGIDISAMPPGKKLQNVNLLSGGEKTLTAISLLMAIFTVKPSPFFLLDEVDAALDDANAGRFNGLLREMATASQFLMITHNKASIEIADTMFGVTMQEPGLSKLVTVDLVS
ncbi:MAG: chromosome segregation protein SMC [bacterium]|nr:chromosome segregation protein SMC [bacterium]